MAAKSITTVSTTKPSKLVELNAEIRLRQGNDERTVRVLALHGQRRGANEAQALYEETEASIANREKGSTGVN